MESRFGGNAHYQSIVPYHDNPILQDVAKNGGFDVANERGWTDEVQEFQLDMPSNENMTMDFDTSSTSIVILTSQHQLQQSSVLM